MKPTQRSIFFILLVFALSSSCASPDASSEGSSTTEEATNALIVGGGSSHDFDRWFNQEDVQTLTSAGINVTYTDDPDEILPLLQNADILVLTNNQPIPDSSTREAIFDHAEAGNGLLLIHPALWYNWEDWPSYNSLLVGGGASSHGPYGPFQIKVTRSDHPVMENIPPTFNLEDELYRFEADADSTKLEILAVGIEPDTGTEYPVAWVVDHPTKRIVGITLGHDGFTHQSEAYKTLLVNAIRWLSR